MSVDYKTMSRDKALDQLDLIPSWAFWREGCHTFAKNVCKVMEMAGQDYSITNVFAFLSSLPFVSHHPSSAEWQKGFCSQCLKKALENVPEAEKREFADTVLDYFLYYFPDRDRVTRWMLIDAFVGFNSGILEAQKELKKGGSH